ncbi:MAG TPA: MFS transporter, partial [Opitutus sp.]|nr:MFS transporter [Opitutus sp.]
MASVATSVSPDSSAPKVPVENTVLPVILALSFCHLVNDTIQALLPSIYPMLKDKYALTFTQIGMITFTFQVTASLLQPVVGFYTDRRPKPYSLAIGMTITLVGLILLARAGNYSALLIAGALTGIGSSIFHPEASRLAHMAAGQRHGFAQSLFQVGGNFGSSLGPLAAAAIIVPRGQESILWFTVLAGTGIGVLVKVARWYQRRLAQHLARSATRSRSSVSPLPRNKVIMSLAILGALIFSKYFYLVSLTNYYTFYLIDRFNVSVST